MVNRTMTGVSTLTDEPSASRSTSQLKTTDVAPDRSSTVASEPTDASGTSGDASSPLRKLHFAVRVVDAGGGALPGDDRSAPSSTAITGDGVVGCSGESVTSLLTAGASVTVTVVVSDAEGAGGTAAPSSLELADFVPLPETLEVTSSVESESSEESGSSA
jgi:hypothetical protein